MTSVEPLIGRPAPDFELPCTGPGTADGRARLADYRGRWLGLVFYPRDFSLVCPTELTALGDRVDEFRASAASCWASVATRSSRTAAGWRRRRRRAASAPLAFPLASDEDGRVGRAFGVLLDPPGVTLRGLFLIDPEGLVQYQVVHALGVGRRAEEVLRVLGALRSGGLCPPAGTRATRRSTRPGSSGPAGWWRTTGSSEKLGEGTFAAIFRAFDETLRRTVALKVLKPQAVSGGRAMLDEAAGRRGAEPSERLHRLRRRRRRGRADHRHGVPAGHGGSTELTADGTLPVPRAVAIARQVAAGMAAAHAAGVVHGDLKPQNVLVDEADHAKVVDFGLARRVEHEASDPYETIDEDSASDEAGLTGTPGYMAPEQVRGEAITARSDVFAFGAILFELLTGRRAFGGRNLLQVLEAIRNVRPDELAQQVPEPFASIVRRALEPDPAARDLSMQEIADRLRDAVEAVQRG